MLHRVLSLTTSRGWLAMAGVVVSSKLLIGQVESLVGAVACAERARWELVSCGAPPEAWAMALMLGLLVGLAALAGSEWRLAVHRRARP